MKIAFTLCSNNYLAQAKTLGDSFLDYNCDCRFVIGLVDELHPSIDYNQFSRFDLVVYSTLGCEYFQEMESKYDIVEFNTAVKPFYFKYLFQVYPGSDVFYIDPDIQVFDDFTELYQILDAGNDFILTPHLVVAQKEQSSFERLILQVGTFNLGFIGLRDGDKAKMFLEWWSLRLVNDCKIDFCNGLFVDQKWVNFLPALFDEVFILRHPGYNVGYWNFDERTVTTHDGKYYVNGKSLCFFHFSSYNPLKPEVLCRHLTYSFEQRSDLVSLYESYSKLLLTNRYTFYSSLNPLLKLRQNQQVEQKPVSGLSRLRKKIRRFLAGVF